MVKFGSSFELSFRRSIFSLILLFIYLIISTLIISLIGQFELLKSGNLNKLCKGRKEIQRGRRLDFERNELLNTLWADSLAVRTESDWKQLANAKFDSYERIILSSKISNNYCNSRHSTIHFWDFISSLRFTFLLISTVGESNLNNQKQFSGPLIQSTSILISLFGIPLLLIHLEHSIKAIYAFCEDNFERPNLAIIWIFFGNILIITLIFDIILEENLEFNENDIDDNEKNSFFDLFFSIFLLSFTIFKNTNLNKIPIWLFLPICLFLFSINGCLLKYLIELLHNWMAPHEFAFANGFCGKIERAVSGVDIHIEEINNEEDTNSKRNQNSENGVPATTTSPPHFSIGGENEGEIDPNNPTTNQLFAALLRRKSISTIAEEEGELPNSP
uniref:Uncharacterized protein n=1 Tax=Meloidogyne enterolobii TaxID=390850 RepID=A0A6V7W508_MELEN|nr:unnamed protein product [Meloidogyne enterolobii]